MSGKCQAGYDIPDDDDEPCPKCGATWRDRCGVVEGKTREEFKQLRTRSLKTAEGKSQ